MNSDVIHAIMQTEPVRSHLLVSIVSGLVSAGVSPYDATQQEFDGAMRAAVAVVIDGASQWLCEVPLHDMPEEIAKQYLAMPNREEVSVIRAPPDALTSVAELAGRAAAEHLARAIKARLHAGAGGSAQAARTRRIDEN